MGREADGEARESGGRKPSGRATGYWGRREGGEGDPVTATRPASRTTVVAATVRINLGREVGVDADPGCPPARLCGPFPPSARPAGACRRGRATGARSGGGAFWDLSQSASERLSRAQRRVRGPAPATVMPIALPRPPRGATRRPGRPAWTEGRGRGPLSSPCHEDARACRLAPPWARATEPFP